MSTDIPTRLRILEAIRARVEVIKAEAGFRTNAGEYVELGWLPTLGEDDPDVAIAVVPGTEAPIFQQKQVFSLWPIEVHAIAKVSLDEPWVAIELVIADIKEAVELEDRTLGGLCRPMIERLPGTRVVTREPGSTTVGAALTYTTRLLEVWGNPT